MNVLVARFKVNPLILVTVVSGTRVDVYAAHIVIGWTTRCLACVRVHWKCAINSGILTGGSRHAFEGRQTPTEVAKPRTQFVQVYTGRGSVEYSDCCRGWREVPGGG